MDRGGGRDIANFLQEDHGEGWEFPEARLRNLLVQWGQLDESEPKDVQIQLVHVGDKPPELPGLNHSVILRSGNVVQPILDAAVEYDVNFICMPTAGHHGVLDVLRGSTTERVLRHAPCLLLAMPVV